MAKTTISIPGVERRSFQITIEGETPLISNRFSDKKKKEILDKQMKKVEAAAARPPKDPDADYLGSIYRTAAGEPGFPASGIKKACVHACRFLKMRMVEARGAFFVVGDIIPIDGEPQMREDKVTLKGSTADLRYRAMYPKWSITLTVLHSPHVITEESIANLLEIAGFHIGIGDWRPEKGGTKGMFRVRRE